MQKLAILDRFPMKDWRQMDSFIATTHGENHVLRNRPLFDWFFLRDQSREFANLIVAYEGDRLVSLLGYIPTVFLWGEERLQGAWMAHWMTLEGHRHGVGALLMRKITELFPIVAGQGASQMNQDIVTKMGFKFLPGIPKTVFVFNPEAVAGRFGYRGRSAADLPHLEQPNQVTALTARIFEPDWEKYPSLRFGTLRDRDYLNHRYVDYPFFKYELFVEGEAAAPAVCIARIVDTNEGIRVARIVEFFYPENEPGERQGLALLRKCLGFFARQGCDYADFYCTSAAYIEQSLKAGFSRDDEGALPSLLDPIDLSRKRQNNELYLSPALRKKYPDSADRLLVTRADGDQDRPNQTFRMVAHG